MSLIYWTSTRTCKITRKQYNSGDSELKKRRFEFKRNQITTDLICLSYDTVLKSKS